MARPLRINYPGAFYHVTSRGNEQKKIFKNRRDREKFLEYLSSATKRYDAVIHVFCLMDNHYHLLLETPSGNLPQIMRHINAAYTTYFNVKRDRSGHLFQGRYKAILVDQKYESPLTEVVSSTLLGSPGFISFVSELGNQEYHRQAGALVLKQNLIKSLKEKYRRSKRNCFSEE